MQSWPQCNVDWRDGDGALADGAAYAGKYSTHLLGERAVKVSRDGMVHKDLLS